MTYVSTGKYDLFNKHGARLCDHVGCRKHKQVKAYAKGMFCTKHRKTLESLRERLQAVKEYPHWCNALVKVEIALRTEEMLMRKRFCAKHVKYLRTLEEQVISERY